MSTTDSIPRADLGELIAEARDAGASPHQLAVMTRSADSGSMKLDDLKELLPDLLACFESAGFTTLDQGTIEYYPGFPIPSYGYNAPANLTQKQVSDITASCSNANYDWAQIFYVSQGSAIDAYEQSFLDQRDPIEECLRSHGVTVDDDAPADELIFLVTDDHDVAGNDLCYEGDVFVGYTRP